jgi:hypothetical protein
MCPSWDGPWSSDESLRLREWTLFSREGRAHQAGSAGCRGIATLRSYEARWLPHDIAAGLVLTTALAPVGIAYAVASGLPGVYGLYATIVPLLAYVLFGPSRILALGPDSALAAVILGVTVPLATGDVNRAIALAGMMAIVAGAVCILAGVVRLGFVTELLSKPIRYRVHEWNRARGSREPDAQAGRRQSRRRLGRCATSGRSPSRLLAEG